MFVYFVPINDKKTLLRIMEKHHAKNVRSNPAKRKNTTFDVKNKYPTFRVIKIKNNLKH